MPESLRPRNIEKIQTPKIEATAELRNSPEYQKECAESYERAQAYIDALKAPELPPNLSLKRIERSPELDSKKEAAEVCQFYDKHFDPEQNEDEMQKQISIEQHFADFYQLRNQTGTIVGCVQTVAIPIPGEKGEPGLGHGVWYSAMDEEYRSQNLSLILYKQSLEDALNRAKEAGVPMRTFLGETDPEMEDYVNNTFDRKRMYYQNAAGEVVEVPYMAAPENESDKGVRQNLMPIFFDGTKTLSGNRMAAINENIHAMYTRPEFFTPDYATFSQGRYGIQEASRDQQYRSYLRTVRSIDNTFRSQVGGVKEIFMLSRAEREEMRGRGYRIIDNIDR